MTYGQTAPPGTFHLEVHQRVIAMSPRWPWCCFRHHFRLNATSFVVHSVVRMNLCCIKMWNLQRVYHNRISLRLNFRPVVVIRVWCACNRPYSWSVEYFDSLVCSNICGPTFLSYILQSIVLHYWKCIITWLCAVVSDFRHVVNFSQGPSWNDGNGSCHSQGRVLADFYPVSFTYWVRGMHRRRAG